MYFTYDTYDYNNTCYTIVIPNLYAILSYLIINITEYYCQFQNQILLFKIIIVYIENTM